MEALVKNTSYEFTDTVARLGWRISLHQKIVAAYAKTDLFASYLPVLQQRRNDLVDACKALPPEMVTDLNKELVRLGWMLDLNQGHPVTWLQNASFRFKVYSPENVALPYDRINSDEDVEMPPQKSLEPCDPAEVSSFVFVTTPLKKPLLEKFNTVLKPAYPEVVPIITFLRNLKPLSPNANYKIIIDYWKFCKDSLFTNIDALACGKERASLASKTVEILQSQLKDHHKNITRGDDSLEALSKLLKTCTKIARLFTSEAPELRTLTRLAIKIENLIHVYSEILTDYKKFIPLEQAQSA